MKRLFKITLPLLAFSLLWCQCKDVYISPYKSPTTGYLVVEGYISGNSVTQFKLSRTIPISSVEDIPTVSGAAVQVEGNDNTTYPLAETDSGTYSSGIPLSLNPGGQYRLRVNTTDGKSYLSDYVSFISTPAIDSISWVQNALSVQIYANTHDPANNTHYYQWAYNETWQYYSAESSNLQFDRATWTVIPRPDQIFTCWRNDISTQLLLGSSAKLAQDAIHLQPLVQIPANSQQLAVLYSILVYQYALTKDAYNFLTLMQKNTESLGSIFDAQPSALKGNIHCLSDSSEPVVGYVSAGTVQQQRIYISRAQVSDWRYTYSCPFADTLVGNDSMDIEKWFITLKYIPVNTLTGPGGFPIGWEANQAGCVDCRLQGGTNVRPAFWPN